MAAIRELLPHGDLNRDQIKTALKSFPEILPSVDNLAATLANPLLERGLSGRGDTRSDGVVYTKKKLSGAVELEEKQLDILIYCVLNGVPFKITKITPGSFEPYYEGGGQYWRPQKLEIFSEGWEKAEAARIQEAKRLADQKEQDFQSWTRRLDPISVPAARSRSAFVNACNKLTGELVARLPPQQYADIFTIFELQNFQTSELPESRTSELLNSYISGLQNSKTLKSQNPEVSTALQKQCQSYIAPFDISQTTLEIDLRVAKMLKIVAETSDKILSKNDKEGILKYFEAPRARFNVNGFVSAVIVLAIKAKREDQNLILVLDTSWIPGLDDPNNKSLKADSLKALLREIDNLGNTLRKMGLDNVLIVHENGKDGKNLAAALLHKAEETKTLLTNVVVFASSEAAVSESFVPLRGKKGAFVCGVRLVDLFKAYEENGDITKDFFVDFMEMLTFTLELAFGKEPPPASH